MANPIVDALGPFIWGAGGAKKTPEEIARDKEVAAQLLMKAGNTSPVQHWSQGAARVVDALGGVLKQKRAEAAGAENATYNEGILKGLLSPQSVPSSGAAAEISATSPAASAAQTQAAPQSVDISGSREEFVNSLLPAAIEESRRTGVDPRIIVAQAAQETGWGRSAPGNNYFGIKSHGQGGGQNLSTEEVIDGKRIRINDSFRQFESPADSVRGYGDFITQNPRYRGMREAQGLDAQLEALQASGYATDPNYSRSVGAIARGIQLPQQVASLDPGAGMATPQTASDAIEAQAPQQALPMGEAQIVGPAPAVASQPMEVAGGGGRPSVFEQPQAAPQQAPGMNEALVRAMTDPRATPQTRAVAQALMQQQMAQQQAAQEMRMRQADPAYRLGLEKSQLEIENLRNPRVSAGDRLAREKFELEKGQTGRTPDINEYEYAKKQGFEGSFPDFILAQKKAAASSTTINNGEGNAFYKKLDEKNAESINSLSEVGMQARAKMGQIDQLEKLINSSPTGAVAALKQAAGEYGINTEGLNDLQAATALINQLVPQQRAPGSGSMSDADLALFKQSLPRLINQPGGNQTILNTMRGITQYQIQTGEIADRVANREITPAEGRSAIAQLPNPLSNFKPPENKAQSAPRPRATNPETGAVLEFDGKSWVPVK